MIASPRKPWIVGTLNEVAEFFGVSASLVRADWRGSGMPGQQGRWDLREILAWRDARRKNPSGPRDDGVGQQMRLAEALLKVEQHRKIKMANDLTEGNLVERDEVELKACEMTLRIKTRLEAMPDEMETEFPSETRADNKASVKAKIHGVLKEMSQWRPSPQTQEE